MNELLDIKDIAGYTRGYLEWKKMASEGQQLRRGSGRVTAAAPAPVVAGTSAGYRRRCQRC